MMKYFSALVFCLNIAVLAWGQTTTSSREAELKAAENRQMGRDPVANRHDQIQKNEKNKTLEQITETDRSGEFIRKRLKERTLTKEDKKKMEAIRAPNPEDVLLHSEFLKQKDTGIFKLFPDLGCVSNRVIRVDGDCQNAVSGSASYSFMRRGYLGTDLGLKEGSLVSDSFLSQNIIVALGPVDLNSVSLEMSQAKFLVDFNPEIESNKAKAQFWQIAQKVSANGFTYGKVARIEDQGTYLIRIIAYRFNDRNRFKSDSRPMAWSDDLHFYYIMADETRRDKIIAFRIVRKESDGSITVLWKELADKKSPILEFEKDEKLTNLKEK
jgi:hypothetical protein